MQFKKKERKKIIHALKIISYLLNLNFTIKYKNKNEDGTTCADKRILSMQILHEVSR